MKVLVCGGRDYNDFRNVARVLNGLVHDRGEIEAIVHGGARGADACAQEWADRYGVCCWVYPADWQTHGRAAGPIRNQKMLDEQQPALVIAFPGGRGTADMVRRAKAAGIQVMENPE